MQISAHTYVHRIYFTYGYLSTHAFPLCFYLLPILGEPFFHVLGMPWIVACSFPWNIVVHLNCSWGWSNLHFQPEPGGWCLPPHDQLSSWEPVHAFKSKQSSSIIFCVSPSVVISYIQLSGEPQRIIRTAMTLINYVTADHGHAVSVALPHSVLCITWGTGLPSQVSHED